MATVYLAEDLKHKRKVAVKVLRPELAAVPNVGDGTWQVSFDGGGEPKWAHCGTELFYREGAKMMVADVITAATLAVSAQRVLFDAGPFFWRSTPVAYGFPLYDVSPDDQRFVMARFPGPSNEAAGQLILVENFFEELKQRSEIKGNAS